ncbi:MAG: hypothetical protein ABI451_02910 [Dokdonella sp.]
MSTNMAPLRVTPRQFREQLERSIDVCGTMGIDINKGRIASYLAVFRTLEAASDNVTQLLDRQLVWAACCETYDLSSLGLLPTGTLLSCRHRLHRLATGPGLYTDAGSADPGRDLAFELKTALSFFEAGAEISMSSPADVVASFDDEKVLVECKRINRKGGLRRRLEEGFDQFLQHRKTESGLGILALDITRVVNKEFGVMVATQEAQATEIHREIESVLANVQEERRRANRNISNPSDVDALMFRVLCMAGTPDGALESVGSTWQIHPLMESNTKRFRRLYDVMQRLPGADPGIFEFA